MTSRALLAAAVGAGVQVSLPADLSIEAIAAAPSAANATVTFNRNGTWSASDGQSGYWILPAAADVGDGYEIAWQAGVGTLTTGTSNTFQALSSARTYGRIRAGVGSAEATGTIEIRRVGAGTPAASCPGSLYAEVLG